jgi:hypothetical protein
MSRYALMILVLLAALPALAEGLPVEMAAKYLLIVAEAAGSTGRIACRETDMAIFLKKQGISVDAKASTAWAFTPAQAKAFGEEGKFVVCNSKKLLTEGGCLAFEKVGGRVTVFVHQENLKRSGVKLPDAILNGAVKI